MAEDYVRPPIVAVEPPSRRAAVWRFRLVMALIVVLVAAGVVLAIRYLTGGGEGGATVGLRLRPAATAAAAVVTGSAGPGPTAAAGR